MAEILAGDHAQAWDEYRLVVLDFDGTMCLGDDPVLLYAQLVDEALATHEASQKGQHDRRRRFEGFSVRDAVRRGLDAGDLNVPEIRFDDHGYPDDITGRTDMALWPLQDGYQLVQLLALQAGLTSADTHAAFRASRTQLLERGLAASDVHAPAGAAAAVTSMQQHAAVVLVTNSPAEDFDVWLAQLGLQNHFDLIINSAGKPAGMAAAVERARATFSTPQEPIALHEVVSVGDIWGNDLEYVHHQGGTTVLIDRFATGLGSPDHRVADAAGAFRLLNDVQVTTK